jgi:hypothetical protein
MLKKFLYSKYDAKLNKRKGVAMKKCQLERVVFTKGNQKPARTGDIFVTFIENASEDLVGATVELKKRKGLWVVNAVDSEEIDGCKIKRIWGAGDI